MKSLNSYSPMTYKHFPVSFGFHLVYGVLDQNNFSVFVIKNPCPGSGSRLDVDTAKPASGSEFSESESADGQTTE